MEYDQTDYSLFRQVVSSMGLLFILYMANYYVFKDGELDMPEEEMMFIVMLFSAMLFTGVAVLVCLVIGLPIRLNKRMNAWWRKRRMISIVGLGLGLAVIFMAWLGLSSDDNELILVVGWFLSGFFALHIYPKKVESSSIDFIN